MKIVSIVGARPEFIQAAPVSRALRAKQKHHEILVHTGQHYDYLMSQAFFDELDIPAPDYNLEVGSGSHGRQTAETLVRLEEVLLKEQPDLVIVRGDTNSTLAGALAASKLHIPTAHIEAGERSYDRAMPEEINRLVADCLADVYFCVSQEAVHRLVSEGITEHVHWVGDVMLDALFQNQSVARRKSDALTHLNLKPGTYALVTIHRAANTDDPERLQHIVDALNNVPDLVVFPAHPRTRQALVGIGAQLGDHIRLIDPVGYFDMMVLEENARLIATDSGGVQREAYFLGVPCLTLRDETEWVETVTVGWNKLVGAEPQQILNAWLSFEPPLEHPPIFGDGTAGQRIAQILDQGNIGFGQPRRQGGAEAGATEPVGKGVARMTVGIVGGGIMGISLGYFLSQQGVKVEIFEASPVLGGLAGPIILEDGTAVDRFYHAILSSDSHLRQLCTELDIADQLRFRETKMGFFYNDEIYSMNSVVEFFRFPPLNWIDRFRLGLTVLYAQFVRDWHQLEGISVEDWLVRWSGRGTYENIWRPLLKAKFDGNFADAPATYIWSRLVRMKSTRSGANQKEEAGHLIGGYITLIEAMADRIEDAGGRIHLRCPVQEILIEHGRAQGIRINDEVHPFSAVVTTLQVPIFRRLIPSADQDYHDYLGQTEYLGIIAPLLVLDRPLTDYWTLNITDDRIPFTGIIETTTYIDPQYVGGHHLVYLPKYTAPDSEWQKLSDDEIREVWLKHLEAMFPDFDRNSVRYFLVHRERYVEPLHGLNQTHFIPAVKTPVVKLYLATTAQIYPALTNGESVSQHAREAAHTVLGEYDGEAGAQRTGVYELTQSSVQ